MTPPRVPVADLTPAEWAAAALKQADTARMRVALVQTEHLRELLAERPEAGRWQLEYETYEVLIGDTIYDECDSLGSVTHAVGKALAEIEADELVGEIRTRRIVRYLRAEGGE